MENERIAKKGTSIKLDSTTEEQINEIKNRFEIKDVTNTIIYSINQYYDELVNNDKLMNSGDYKANVDIIMSNFKSISVQVASLIDAIESQKTIAETKFEKEISDNNNLLFELRDSIAKIKKENEDLSKEKDKIQNDYNDLYVKNNELSKLLEESNKLKEDQSNLIKGLNIQLSNLEEVKEINQKFDEEKDKLAKKHAEELVSKDNIIESLKADFDRKTEAINKETLKLKEDYEMKIKKLEDDYKELEKSKNLELEKERELLKDLQEKNEKNMDKLRTEYNSKIDSLTGTYEVKLSSLREENAKALEAKDNQINGLINKIGIKLEDNN